MVLGCWLRGGSVIAVASGDGVLFGGVVGVAKRGGRCRFGVLEIEALEKICT